MSGQSPEQQSELQIEDHGAVRMIRLNRPTRLNALTYTMLLALSQAVRDARECGFRALVLTGAGKGFCTGAELNENTFEDRVLPEYDGSPGGPPVRTARENLWVELAHSVVRDLDSCPIPSIAAINGTVAGGGFDLALACDFRIAARNAKFHPAMRNLGLAPDLGASWLLTRAVGRERAKHFYLVDGSWSAEDALRHGVVTEVIDNDLLEQTALSKAAAIAKLPALTVAATKRLINGSDGLSLMQAQAAELDVAHLLSHSPDGLEAVAALLGKREPRFKHGL